MCEPPGNSARTTALWSAQARSRDYPMSTPTDDERATQLELARETETQANCLARDIRTLTQWLSHDVLALAGPALAARQVLFDFLVEELAHREPQDVRRIRPVRVALQNQRDDLPERVNDFETADISI